MANTDIQGQITDGSGNPVSNADVYAWREDLVGAGGVVASTTADSNGNFIFNSHPDGSGNSESWHIAAEDPAGNVQLQSAYGVTASLQSGRPAGLRHHWTFDDADTNSGTAVDTIGSNDGTINGPTTGVSGISTQYNSGEAYQFDQSNNDHVAVSRLGIDETQDGIAFSFFVKFDNVNSGQGVYEIKTQNANHFLFLKNNGEMSGAYLSTGNTPGVQANVQSGQAYHIVHQYETGGTYEIYKDATRVDRNTTGGPVNNTRGTSAVGAQLARGRYIDGVIDEFQIYDQSLTSSEITNLFQKGSI
jgi:hypothetical protein